MERSKGCLEKLDRMLKTLRHEEADRVPVSDFFWGGFLRRWIEELGLPDDTDIYDYYDLDWQCTTPNMDPHIKSFEILKENDEEVLVRTGYEAVIRKKFADPMPAFLSFSMDDIDQLEDFVFDDPWDDRRYFSGGDNQIAGVGDGFARNTPPWIDTVKEIYPKRPVFGSICEGHEQVWRIVGSENVMMWIGLYPEKFGRFVERVGDFLVEMTKAQIKAAGGMLDGMVIWGDVAYVNGMLFSPVYWRRWFKPIVEKMVQVCHEANIPVIYHGCGNATSLYEDFIAMGMDCYNPLEARAGLDVVQLRQEYGHRMAFCGNMDVLEWAEAPMDELKRIVMRKLNAAKGGGYIFQSDHSVPSNVSAERYEFAINLVRKHGVYPLQLGEYDIPELG
ncbi:MAG: uroporphyrinogen decarboxylase family protein [Sphaerochaetaceae bacterium]|nr:uroporphyrinogen decarboxylase family protein [Sphaerochaetaceae bacterium]MDD4219904.1 uroporphyrinogen decarboxylase family protein [Sphaerochaetaceae bacterium]